MHILFAGNGNNLTSYSLHTNSSYEIILTTSGQGSSLYGKEIYSVGRGTLALLPPNTPHCMKNGKMYCDLYIATDEFDIVTNKPLVLQDEGGLIEPLMHTLYTIWLQKEENYQQLCDQLLDIICKLIRKLHKNQSRYAFVDKLKNTLTIHFSDANYSWTEEAAVLGVSTDYLRHCFKAETGMTPLEYLTHLRITQAQRYLAQKNGYTISEIAFRCGFSDPYYFSRCFKKLTNKSPSAYRKEC